MVDKMTSIKIYCKDSRCMDEVAENSVHLIVTSPPYFDLKNYNSNNNHTNQAGDIPDYREYISFLNQVWKECVRVLYPDGKLCINIMPLFLSGNESVFRRRETKLLITDLERYMLETECMYLHSLYIWDKRKIVRFSSFGSYPYPGNIFSTFPFEWIIVFSKKGKRERVPKEIKEQSRLSRREWLDWAVNSIWEMQPAKAQLVGHPAPFPDELPRRLIKLYTILDPFLGSGTTVRVAHSLGRHAIGYEVNPTYVEIAKRSLAQLSLEL
jgi:DNA modification methylase